MTKTMWTAAMLFLAGAFALTGCASETSPPEPDEATPPASAPEEKEATPAEQVPEVVSPTRPLVISNPLYQG